MKYTKEERLNIGRQIYDSELSCYAAAEEYGINEQTARNYMRMYRDVNHLPPKHNPRNSHNKAVSSAVPSGLEDYEAIVSHALSSRRGDRMTYISGLNDLIALKKQYPEYEMVLHSDQGSVYSSKKFNELLPMYNIVHSMSRAGTPTDNAAMEAINGWIKADLFTDLHVTQNGNTAQEISDYLR